MKKRSRMIPGNSKKSRVWQKTNGHCHLCSQKLKRDDWRIDHLIPRDDGGPDDEWNLLPSCVFCNGMKKAADRYKMRRILMYGRYCLDEATRRWSYQDLVDTSSPRPVSCLVLLRAQAA